MKNIDKQEKEYLIQEKLREGKGITQASEEVERDREHINNLNEMKKRLNREIKELEKKKKSVSKTFKKEFTKLTKPSEPENNKLKNNVFGSATTKHLNRILYYLEEHPKENTTKIAVENCMGTSYVKDGLKFLIKLNKVEEGKRVNGVSTYSLK